MPARLCEARSGTPVAIPEIGLKNRLRSSFQVSVTRHPVAVDSNV
jgi:hypothetical protein